MRNSVAGNDERAALGVERRGDGGRQSAAREGSTKGTLQLAAGLVLLGAGVFSLGGCNGIDAITIPNIFRVMPERPLADVPVPVGMRLKHRGSYVLNSNFRVARLRYTGGLRVETIVAFYKEQMPLSRWTLVEVLHGKRSGLRYQNDQETCTVRYGRDGGMSRVDIEIAPRET